MVGEVVLVLDFVVEHADAEDGEQTGCTTAAQTGGDEDEGTGRYGVILAMGGLEHAGAGGGNGEGEGVLLLLGEEEHVKLLAHLMLADEGGEGLLLGGELFESVVELMLFLLQLLEPQVKVGPVVGEGATGGGQGGGHLLAASLHDGVVGTGAAGQALVVQAGLVVCIDGAGK